MDKGRKLAIIITGVSGSGKTTLTKQLTSRYELNRITLDDFIELEWDKYGFVSEAERESLRVKGKQNCKDYITMLILQSKSFVFEYPFRESWNAYFDQIKAQGYEVVYIICDYITDEVLRDRLMYRVLDSKQRHPAHGAKYYHKASEGSWIVEYPQGWLEEFVENTVVEYHTGEYTQYKNADVVLHYTGNPIFL